MDRFQAVGQWNQLKGKIKERWGELTDDDIMQTQGNIDQLIGKIQEKYGGTTEEIRQEIEEMRSGM
ncbi:MAG TPA: CsbD family protein [Chloroflexota bacterium]|nr:CsbD family protein [Chloroflexota bacterium]